MQSVFCALEMVKMICEKRNVTNESIRKNSFFPNGFVKGNVTAFYIFISSEFHTLENQITYVIVFTFDGTVFFFTFDSFSFGSSNSHF